MNNENGESELVSGDAESTSSKSRESMGEKMKKQQALVQQVQKFDAAVGGPQKNTLKKQLTIKPPKVIKKIIKKGTQKFGGQGQGA